MYAAYWVGDELIVGNRIVCEIGEVQVPEEYR